VFVHVARRIDVDPDEPFEGECHESASLVRFVVGRVGVERRSSGADRTTGAV
jgi:hypothetical protein